MCAPLLFEFNESAASAVAEYSANPSAVISPSETREHHEVGVKLCFRQPARPEHKAVLMLPPARQPVRRWSNEPTASELRAVEGCLH
jgi:hypothetical protein